MQLGRRVGVWAATGKLTLDEFFDRIRRTHALQRDIRLAPKLEQDTPSLTGRAHGDLSENAEFTAAKERQSFIEGRAREIENILAQVEVIDRSPAEACAFFDDVPAFVEAACALGIQGQLFTTAANFRVQLARLGLATDR